MSTAIKEMRRESGVSQRQLAKLIGIDGSHLSKIEQGTSQPTVKRLHAIAEAIGADDLASCLAPQLPQQGQAT
jgi:transcriptional regulator with XRE-family HTH domain